MGHPDCLDLILYTALERGLIVLMLHSFPRIQRRKVDLLLLLEGGVVAIVNHLEAGARRLFLVIASSFENSGSGQSCTVDIIRDCTRFHSICRLRILIDHNRCFLVFPPGVHQ